MVALASFELGLIVIQILPVTTVSTTGDVWKIVRRIYVIILSVEGASTMQMNEPIIGIYRKIPKISPSMYKPPKYKPPKLVTQKTLR